MSALERLYPVPGSVTDEELLDWYTEGRTAAPWVSFNFVSSIDGAATIAGRSGQLGNATDQHIFTLLRRHADVILVGAQTVRSEGYGGPLLSAEARQWRADHGLAVHPPLAIVSGSLNLDPSHEVFTQAPVRPLVITVDSAPAEQRTRLEAVADIITAGRDSLDVDALLAALAHRGFQSIHSEGGPTLLGTFQASDRVDELCLTVSPLLVGGAAGRIAGGPAAPEDARDMELAHILRAGSMLFLRYLRSGRAATPRP